MRLRAVTGKSAKTQAMYLGNVVQELKIAILVISEALQAIIAAMMLINMSKIDIYAA